MLDPQHMTLQDAANTLEVSPTVLRRWLDAFGEFLSVADGDPDADPALSEADVSLLADIKTALDDGRSFEQVRHTLRQRATDDDDAAPQVISSAGEETAIAPISYFADIIDELHKGQLSVLNSQAANRELMGVLIQDNFNLKEENQRLRERMLDVERRLSQIQRDEISRRESLRQEIELKLSEIRMQVMRNPVTVLQERTGCLGSLFGGQSAVKTVNLGGETSAAPPPPRPPRPPGPPE